MFLAKAEFLMEERQGKITLLAHGQILRMGLVPQRETEILFPKGE